MDNQGIAHSLGVKKHTVAQTAHAALRKIEDKEAFVSIVLRTRESSIQDELKKLEDQAKSALRLAMRAGLDIRLQLELGEICNRIRATREARDTRVRCGSIECLRGKDFPYEG